MTPSARHPGAVLRELLARRRAFITPGCHDALGATLIEQAGFEAVYMSGYCVAAAYGRPDIGLISGSQMVERASQIIAATTLPVLVDADTGYGGVSNIVEAVRAYERAGAAGLHLEDQVSPKKCGAMAGKALVSDEEMRERLRAALRARRSPDFLIIGRTDAVSLFGIDEAIRRLKVMADCGVDAVMAPALSSLEDCRRAAEAVSVPVLHTVTETVRPVFPQAQLAETGLGMAMYPVSLVMAIVGAQRRLLAELKATGDTAASVAGMEPLPAISRLLGAEQYAAFETAISQGQ
jgi:methylisocitrate lyase